MAKGLDIEARLVISRGRDDIQIAASGTYLIVNIPSQRVLDELTAGDKTAAPKAPKPPGTPNALQQLNMLALRLGLVLDLRVAGKTYVTFGTGRSPKITFNAVLGKIGSFFRSE
ncbi:hypothetical protein FY528_13770 [Hymenobacter lutimineralis]|uniref:Uncharacterized protein n=1 Tax=Hymenobacter lutimineralis TaxID=2606448 RepID=A0A5D6UYS2_9BACT|nr:hypothetical protein [Hymenobacter lutimineralis]TYZ08107.1 hypothetical protein FY528_13770 [Hymenobacter lutimineralis]